MTTYGYIRTSRQRIQGTAGSDPLANIYRDVGVSGTIGTQVRQGWHQLDVRLAGGDTLVVVAIDRIGRIWQDTGRGLQVLWGLKP